MRARPSSHEIAIQASHAVDRAERQAKMASDYNLDIDHDVMLIGLNNNGKKMRMHNRVNELQFLSRILKFQRILLTKKRDENDVQKVWIWYFGVRIRWRLLILEDHLYCDDENNYSQTEWIAKHCSKLSAHLH